MKIEQPSAMSATPPAVSHVKEQFETTAIMGLGVAYRADQVNAELSRLRQQLADKDTTLGAYIKREQDIVLQLAAVNADRSEWLKANGPGGWIDDLRKKVESFESHLAAVRGERPEVERIRQRQSYYAPAIDGVLQQSEDCAALLSALDFYQHAEAMQRNARIRELEARVMELDLEKAADIDRMERAADAVENLTALVAEGTERIERLTRALQGVVDDWDAHLVGLSAQTIKNARAALATPAQKEPT